MKLALILENVMCQGAADRLPLAPQARPLGQLGALSFDLRLRAEGTTGSQEPLGSTQCLLTTFFIYLYANPALF